MANSLRVKIEKTEDDSPENGNSVIEIGDDDDICELEHLRKLFIGGLAPYTTEEGLKNFYGQWGKVVDVVVMRDNNTKRSRGFGFITYTKSAMVDRAQENRPHVIDGKTVEAKRALPRPERESRETNISVKKLFVGGLKDNHDDDCLREYFSQFGNVISVKLLTDKTTGKRRGFAFIEFDDYDAVDKAILQKTHSIKYVLVDVKKSIYNLEKKDKSGNMNAGAGNMHQVKPNQKSPGQPTIPNRPPPSSQQMMPPYHQQPPPGMNAPPPNYNYWGPPPPMPQQYYQQAPPPPQMNNWNYPAAPNGWNAPPPLPPNAPHWQANQWGGPPAAGGPPRNMPPAAPPAGANWNALPASTPLVPGPPGAPNGNVSAPPPQQQPPPNFGTGYQQNYGGGPTKHSNMNNNRMNPYTTPNNNYVNNVQPPIGANYTGYNAGPPNNLPSPSGPVTKPMANGNPAVSANGTKYRR